MPTQPSPQAIAAAILSAPHITTLGLSVRDQRLRQRAALDLAERIARSLDDPVEIDPRQLGLAL